MSKRPMKPYILPLFLLNFVSFLLVCVPIHSQSAASRKGKKTTALTKSNSVLITCSAPFTNVFYFLQAPTTGGFTRFGLLGWQETPSGASVGPQCVARSFSANSSISLMKIVCV